jgi:hypothetical protein
LIKPVDYLDVGLFLDHRNTRQMVQEAAGKRVLNLFAYTGVHSLCAAGGASETLTIDRQYLEWADRNLSNNFSGKTPPAAADVLAWLEQPELFDLIVLDRPLFQQTDGRHAHIQRDRDAAQSHVAFFARRAERCIFQRITGVSNFGRKRSGLRRSQILPGKRCRKIFGTRRFISVSKSGNEGILFFCFTFIALKKGGKNGRNYRCKKNPFNRQGD